MPVTSQTTSLQTERRFPLDLHKADDDIRGLYEDAKKARWDPETDLPWKQQALAALDEKTRSAARRVWSRRAWVEFTGMTETPALLIRFCLELNRESDPKYFLTVRNTEEAWHVECFHRYAEICGGYIDSPANPAWERVFNRNLYRDALNAEVPIDTYVAAHCAFVDGLELELARLWAANANEPVARAILEHCLSDYARHARFGWMYARRRAATMSAEMRERVAAALKRHIEEVEFAGYHCVALATTIDTRPDAADLELVTQAGLGAAAAAQEVAVFRDCVTRSRQQFADFGVALPTIQHPQLGSF